MMMITMVMISPHKLLCPIESLRIGESDGDDGRGDVDGDVDDNYDDCNDDDDDDDLTSSVSLPS